MSDEIRNSIRNLRRGDALEVAKFSDLARTLVEALELVNEIHDKGCIVVETTTGRTSDKDLGKMISGGLRKLRKGRTHRQSVASGRQGGAPLKDREMSHEAAEKIWRNVARYRTDAIAIAHMPGWNRSAAYRRFGRSGRQEGRPKLKPTKRR